MDEHRDYHLTDGQWHDRCVWCQVRRAYGGTGMESESMRRWLGHD